MNTISTIPLDPRPTSPATVGSDSAQPVSAGTTPETCEVSSVEADLLDRVRPALVDSEAAVELAATFAVLGDPTRVRLLDALAQHELCVCELAELVGSTESAVSHQLRLLRSLRLVRSRRAGRMVYYSLDDDHIRALLTQGRRHVEEGSR